MANEPYVDSDAVYSADTVNYQSPTPRRRNLINQAADWMGGAWDTITGRTPYVGQDRQLDQTKADQWRDANSISRGSQGSLGAILAQSAVGRGPSYAQEAALQAEQAARASAASQAASARGGNVALASRSAANQSAAASAGIAGEAAMARAREIIDARNAYSQHLAAQRQGDISSQQTDIDAAKANLEARIALDKARQEQENRNADRNSFGLSGLASGIAGIFG